MKFMYADAVFRESWVAKKSLLPTASFDRTGAINPGGAWDPSRRPPSLQRVEWEFWKTGGLFFDEYDDW